MPQTRLFPVDPVHPDPVVIQQAADCLRAGGLVAFPTETVYGLGANAFDPAAVNRIFSAKERPVSDPVIVHLYDVNQLKSVAVEIPPLAYDLARQFWPGPLTLVLRRASRVPPNVSAGRDTVAVRMPAHPVALALLHSAGLPVAAPSANRFARPSATTAAHILEDLNGRVDVILDGGPAFIGLESTILDVTRTPPAILRPGGVTLEALRAVVPDVQIISRHLNPDDAGIEAPGMLLKHYSPRARLLLFAGSPPAVFTAMQSHIRDLLAAGQQVGVMALDADAPQFAGLPVRLFLLGNSLEEAAARLFIGMRELDSAGVDAILVRGFEQVGLGAALWDRLVRAAEGRIIHAD